VATKYAFYDTNAGSPNTAFQFGPYTVAGSGKLVAVFCTLGVSADALTVTSADYISDPISWGVQRGPAGYGGVVTPGQAGSPYWFWTELVVKSAWHDATWAPSTSDGLYLVTGGTYQEWRGQEQRGGDTDFYVTGSFDVSGAPNFWAYHMLTIFYA
jgi:hypothetical protein